MQPYRSLPSLSSASSHLLSHHPFSVQTELRASRGVLFPLVLPADALCSDVFDGAATICSAKQATRGPRCPESPLFCPFNSSDL